MDTWELVLYKQVQAFFNMFRRSCKTDAILESNDDRLHNHHHFVKKHHTLDRPDKLWSLEYSNRFHSAYCYVVMEKSNNITTSTGRSSLSKERGYLGTTSAHVGKQSNLW